MEKDQNYADNKHFERLKKGEIIPSDDSRAYKMREASFATKALLLKMKTPQTQKKSEHY